MKDFELFDLSTAPLEAKPILAKTQEEFKMIPNLERTMALAPALLEAYSTAWSLFSQTSLSPAEQQVVYQLSNFENECNYCVPWHTMLSLQSGMSAQDADALRNGRRLSTARLEGLRFFTQALLRSKGRIVQADLDAFYEAGYTSRHALEVVLGIAIKVMSNYTNSIAGTPLDKVVQKYKWVKPIIKQREQS